MAQPVSFKLKELPFSIMVAYRIAFVPVLPMLLPHTFLRINLRVSRAQK